jgi:NTE family protein
MSLASNLTSPAVQEWRATFPEHRTWKQRDLAFVPTTFDRLETALCRLLVYRGWWLAGATIASYHPGLTTRPASAPPLA